MEGARIQIGSSVHRRDREEARRRTAPACRRSRNRQTAIPALHCPAPSRAEWKARGFRSDQAYIAAIEKKPDAELRQRVGVVETGKQPSQPFIVQPHLALNGRREDSDRIKRTSPRSRRSPTPNCASV